MLEPYKEVAKFLAVASKLEDELEKFPSFGLPPDVDARISKAASLAEELADHLALAYRELSK